MRQINALIDLMREYDEKKFVLREKLSIESHRMLPEFKMKIFSLFKSSLEIELIEKSDRYDGIHSIC